MTNKLIHKNEDTIMLPVSGNILLYDFSENIHSQRLKIVYDSSGNCSQEEEKDSSIAKKVIVIESIPYVVFILFMKSYYFS